MNTKWTQSQAVPVLHLASVGPLEVAAASNDCRNEDQRELTRTRMRPVAFQNARCQIGNDGNANRCLSLDAEAASACTVLHSAVMRDATKDASSFVENSAPFAGGCAPRSRKPRHSPPSPRLASRRVRVQLAREIDFKKGSRARDVAGRERAFSTKNPKRCLHFPSSRLGLAVRAARAV